MVSVVRGKFPSFFSLPVEVNLSGSNERDVCSVHRDFVLSFRLLHLSNLSPLPHLLSPAVYDTLENSYWPFYGVTNCYRLQIWPDLLAWLCLILLLISLDYCHLNFLTSHYSILSLSELRRFYEFFLGGGEHITLVSEK
jgi:hypothetical protein